MNDIKEKYKFISKEGEEWASICLIGGNFDGVIYRYGKVSIPEETEKDGEGNLPFRFEYDIVDNNSIPRENFDNEFFKLIGDILVDIIHDQMKEDNVEFRTNNWKNSSKSVSL